MSTSLLYHAWGIRGYDYVRTEYRGGMTFFYIRHQDGSLVCPECGNGVVIKRGTREREFAGVPIGGRAVRIVLDVQRVECSRCKAVRQMKLGFADERFRYTRAFERYVLGLLGIATIKDVAAHLGMSWDVIKEIQKRHLGRHYGKPRLRNLSQIAIDELSIGAGHRFVTIVLDLDSGAVVFVGDGKGADALIPFWKRLKRSGAKVKAVATDMSPAFISAVQENLPSAMLVFDRFHVMKLYNDKLSELRRDVQREATTRLQMQTLKGIRWLLLKNGETLEEQRRGRRLSERERLDRALKINEPLACAYYLKEDLRRFWEQGSKAEAAEFLTDWIGRAETSGVRMLKSFAKTLAKHRSGLLAWYDYQISTGPLEGTNNKIRVMLRKSYGLRDKEFRKLKIYSIHEQKYALVG
jgi:transposase